MGVKKWIQKEWNTFLSSQPCPKRGLEKQSRRWKVMWGPGVGVTTYLYTDGNDSVGES